PTTSEAIPAFARQTGAACLSCHFQSFPTLSAFGRSFKMGALTDVGEQALVEDEALSIPATLNATIVFRPQVIQQSATGTPTTKEIGYVDQVVLIGGRIGPNAGAFVELGGGAFGNHQLFTSFDLGGFKAGINYANTGFGSDSALQLGNTWGQHGGMMGLRDTSANQFLEAKGRKNAGAAVGARKANYASLVAWGGNDMGAVQIGLVAPSDGIAFGVTNDGGTTAPLTGLSGSTFKAANIVRANGFFDVGGLTAGLGGIFISGNVGDNGQFIAAKQLEMKRWGVEASLEGEMGDTQFGLYADYASAGASSTAKTNVFNTDTVNALKGFGIRGTVKPIHNLVLGAGYSSMKATTKTKTFMVGAEFEVYQNFVIALTYTNEKAGTTTTKTTVLDVEALL
ncbi:MAG: hypothetical protein D6751_03865, partial [Deltaproteobacteria bacterium]